jgi:hypothetical protein
MRTSSILLFSLLYLSTSSFAAPAGLAASIDIGVINDFKPYITPLFIDAINAVTIKEIDVDNFEITEVKVNMFPMDPTYVQLGLFADDNSVRMTA